MHKRLHVSSRSVVITAIVGFCLFFGVTNWYRQVNLVTSQFDMGNMDQTLWHTLHGRIFQMTDPGSPTLTSRAAVHADFLLLIYTPFYALWPDPRTMLVLQVLIVASGAWPLFMYARQRVGDSVAGILAIAYLFYPPQLWGMTFDVHAVVVVAPLLLWAWWAASESRWWLYTVMVGLALIGKEEIGLVVAGMGIALGWHHGHRRMGILSVVFGLGWSILMLSWAIPHARQAPGHFALGYYADYGVTSGEVIRGIITKPLMVVRDFFGGEALGLYRALFAPVAGLAIFGWPILLVALPEFAINLLSNNANQHTIFFQYMSAIVPFVFLATIDGWSRFGRLLHRLHWSRPGLLWERWGRFGLVATMLVSVWIWAPVPGTRHHQDALRAFQPSPYRSAVQLVQRQLQPTDRVVATNNLVPQFSRRDSIWAFPNNLDQADAIVVLEGGDYDFAPAAAIHQAVERLTNDPRYDLVYHHDQFWFFRPIAAS